MESTSTIYTSHRTSPPTLRFLHFNDVYHIEAGSAEPVGGIPRFQTLINHYRAAPQYQPLPNLLTIFSGDAFNPSLESAVTKGSHMIPVLNAAGVDVACVGNHDLDFGVPQFQHLRDQCHFPWLLANVLDPALGEDIAIGGCPKTTILRASNGIKVGVIGLAEREWLETINALPPNLIYQSATATARALVPNLRVRGCQLVIALTHMREPNDLKLARNLPAGLVDLVLGGHDHFYAHHYENGTHVLRSGADFKQLSYIEAWPRPASESGAQSGWDFDIVRRDVVRAIPEDAATVQLVDSLTSSLKSKLEKPVGYTAIPLDARFTTVRTRESNIGNFVCDLMRFYYSADCAIMAGGTVRGDQIYPPGVLRLKDILNCFPFEDPVVVVKVTGNAIREALENGVSLVPALEGRFPQVGGISFEFDASKKSGERVLWVDIGDDELDEQKKYVVATRGYMGRGKDGFDSLKVESEGGQAEEIVSEENGVLISMMLRQYFMSLKVLGVWRRWGSALHSHWSGVHNGMNQKDGIKEPGATPEIVAPAQPLKHERDGSTGHHHHHHHHHPHHHHRTVVDGHLVDSDTEDEEHHSHVVDEAQQEKERELHVMRTVSRKWMRLAGVEHRHVGIADEDEEEFLPHWTRGIAPKLEGRIVITGPGGASLG
ncbi:5- [Lasallia pustulata]|uniref:5'-Nucleotidase C-terminal domain-containing protein n=1 Tax=Lasallia pustulata TaxID=136370 RepID=A0A1W5D8C3_9LECA|nr:5- [Lasallia pustulata]